MPMFNLCRNEALSTSANSRSTFRPAFLDRLFAKPASFESELNDRLAARKALRSARSDAARRGWITRREHRA